MEKTRKLSEEVVKDIKVLLKKGSTLDNLAQAYQVTRRVVSDIQRGVTWKDVHVYPEDMDYTEDVLET